MRPTKIEGMSTKSVKKKWKEKSFAAGVNREVIEKGAEMCGIERDELIATTITAMTKVADKIGLA